MSAANRLTPDAAQWLYILWAEKSGTFYQSERSDPVRNTMLNVRLVPRMIGILERLHTLALLLLVFGWELYHFYTLLFRKH